MKYNIDRKNNYSLASIIDNTLDIVTAVISVDVHNERTIRAQVLELIYADSLFSGAGKYSRAEFLDAVNSLGASISVAINDSVLNITLRATANTFNRLLALLLMMLESPNFPDKEKDRIIATAINNLHQNQENSQKIALENLKNNLYGILDRKYTFSIEESVAELNQIVMKTVQQYHQQTLKKYWICSVAGNEKMVSAFTKLIEKIKKAKDVLLFDAKHEQVIPKQKLSLINIPSRQNIDLSIGAPIPFTLHHPDYIPLSFALAVLGKWGGFAGRLMSTVREQEGLTYGIYSSLEGFSGNEQGYWRIMTFFAPDKTLTGIESTFREVDKIYQHGITDNEFTKFKTILTTSEALLKDSVISQLKDLHIYHFHGFSLHEMKEHKNKIQALTLDEINEVIKKYLNPSGLFISGAGPVLSVKKDLQALTKRLFK